jgi:hypothetical protein
MFDRYTDEQWEAIVAARAGWPPGIDWAEIREEIERAGRGFWRARYARPSNMSPANFERYVAYTNTRKI